MHSCRLEHSILKQLSAAQSSGVLQGCVSVNHLKQRKELRRSLTAMETITHGKQAGRWGATWPAQVFILFIRSLKTRRYESLAIQDIFQFLTVGVLCGAYELVWSQTGLHLQCHHSGLMGSTQDGLELAEQSQYKALMVLLGMFWWRIGHKVFVTDAKNITGLLFFELLFPAFAAMFTALFTFPNEFKVMTKVLPLPLRTTLLLARQK